MSSLSTFFYHNAHILLWIIGLSITGLLVMLLVIFLANHAVKKAGQAPVKKPAKELVKKGPPPPLRMPPPGGRLTEYLTLKGFFRVGELGVLFLRAVHFLRAHTPGFEPLYQLPWYLLIGSAGSGKTTMIGHSNLRLPLGEPDFDMVGEPKIKWWFLNRGVILDIKGNFFVNSHTTESNEDGWRSLLGLLARYRAKRPIDGMILTFPANEFIGKGAFSKEEIVDRAKFIAKKIQVTQHNLGLQLPIYIVITKSDLIPGFKSFCQEIPKENMTNILGWSNPYALSAGYNHAWLDQAFGFLSQILSKIRLEIFASKDATSTRDGIFVFPGQIERVKEGLGIYLDHIFRESSYSESLFLRGIYFTGDGAAHNILESLDAEDIREVDESGIAGQREIYFVDDFVSRKVFAETGISQPVRRRTAIANRNLRIAKLSTAAFVTVGTFGLMHTYNKFREQNEDLLPVLSKINLVLSQLKDIKGSDSTQTVVLFDTYAKQLIQMMHTLSESQFSSIFMPPSWFSPIQDNLNYSLKVSYNHIVLRTIYIDLLLKGRELLYMRPGSGDRSTSLNQIINPLESTEFAFLQNYITRMAELSRMVSLFNGLTKSNDIAPLRELVNYTFKTELPSSFENEFHNFRRVLRDVPFPPIDLNLYGAIAQDTLMTIYRYFLNSIMGKNDLGSLIGRMNNFLVKFGQTRSGDLPNVDELRDVALALDKAVPRLNSSGKTWIDGEYFDLGQDFISVIGLINDTPILGGKTMVNSLASETAVIFNKFKEEFIRLLPSFSDEISISPLVNLKSQVFPSLVLLNLHKGLSSLFKEAFMAPPSNHTLVTVVPENKITYWDPKLIDAADQMLQSFNDFKNKGLMDLPSVMREVVTLMAQESLQANILATIARSQAFIEAPKGYSTGLGAEDVLRTKIVNVKEVAPKFVNLLEALNRGGAGQTFVSLRNLLGTLSLRLLDSVEKAAMENVPYAIKENSFSWWDGHPGAIYSAFNVRDKDDLQRYMALQRDRMKHWAFDFAKYMVDFLSSEIMKEAQFSRNIVDRWRRIIEQLLLADQKKPDGSIAQLETTLLKLNDMDIKTCFQDLKLEGIRDSSGDFFLAVKNLIRREMRARCEVITRGKSIENYNRLSSFFNERLKNRFPFIGNNLGANQGEAEPEDVREFFRMYKDYGNDPAKILNQIAELGGSAAQPVTFLRNMDKIKDFFGEFLDSQANNDVPAIDFSVEFRVNKANEQLANYIVDWAFKASDDNPLTNHIKDLSGRWTFGSPVEFSFRWPENVGVAPTLDEKQKYMNVVDQTASFSFSSRWSLLWMLRIYGQPKPSQIEPTPYLLKFVIPLGPDKSAVAYNRLTLRAPSKGKAPGRIMDMPIFPTEAPSLPQDIIDSAGEPVLTRGKVIPTQVPTQVPDGNSGGAAQNNNPQATNTGNQGGANANPGDGGNTNGGNAQGGDTSNAQSAPPSNNAGGGSAEGGNGGAPAGNT